MPRVKSDILTVRRGRRGFNANALAAKSLTDAYKMFPKLPKDMIKDVHAEAVKKVKEANTEAKEETTND